MGRLRSGAGLSGPRSRVRQRSRVGPARAHGRIPRLGLGPTSGRLGLIHLRRLVHLSVSSSVVLTGSSP
jgi:hypothetical protein